MESPPNSPSEELNQVITTPPPSSPREKICPGAPKIGEGNFPMNDSEIHEKYLDNKLIDLIKQQNENSEYHNITNNPEYTTILEGYSDLYMGDNRKVLEKIIQIFNNLDFNN